MAAMKPISVPCPECGDPVDVSVDVTTEYVDGDGLRVTMSPNVSLMVEHYVAEHAGASLDP